MTSSASPRSAAGSLCVVFLVPIVIRLSYRLFERNESKFWSSGLPQPLAPGTNDASRDELTVAIQGLLPGQVEKGFDLELLNGLLLADTGPLLSFGLPGMHDGYAVAIKFAEISAIRGFRCSSSDHRSISFRRTSRSDGS